MATRRSAWATTVARSEVDRQRRLVISSVSALATMTTTAAHITDHVIDLRLYHPDARFMVSRKRSSICPTVGDTSLPSTGIFGSSGLAESARSLTTSANACDGM